MISREIETRAGKARIHESGVGSDISIVAGHGAGGGIEARDLQALTDVDCHLVLVEQPWRVTGKKVAARPAVLDMAWQDVIAQLTLPDRVVFAGRSAGARVACRTANELGAHGVIALAFPLHPPGKPDRSRITELADVAVPVLVVQGDRDTFGSADEIVTAIEATVQRGPRSVRRIEHADHGFAVPKRSGVIDADVTASIQETVRGFLALMRQE